MPLDTEKLNRSVLGDLAQRGHSAESVSAMSAEEAFDEWCVWHLGGDSWGPELRYVLDNLRSAEKEGEDGTRN